MAKLRGLDIKTDWRPNEQGQVMAHIRIKLWYVPILLAKALHQHHLPYRFWPLIYWRYYTGFAKRQVH